MFITIAVLPYYTFSASKWLGVMKSIQPLDDEVVMVICLEQSACDLYMVQLMPLPPHYLLLH